MRAWARRDGSPAIQGEPAGGIRYTVVGALVAFLAVRRKKNMPPPFPESSGSRQETAVADCGSKSGYFVGHAPLSRTTEDDAQAGAKMAQALKSCLRDVIIA